MANLLMASSSQALCWLVGWAFQNGLVLIIVNNEFFNIKDSCVCFQLKAEEETHINLAFIIIVCWFYQCDVVVC